MNMISIVVIEFNSLEEINRCISAIKQRCTDVDYEIIVSSNSCYPKIKQDLILQSYPDVLWCFNERNGGFGYGMNQGLKSASGDFLVVMNPDVILKGKISILVDFLNSHQDVGAIAPQIVGYNGIVQDSCRKFVTPWRFLLRQVQRVLTGNELVKNEKIDYTRPQTADWLSGAFMMLKRIVYESVGGFDEGYFMYCEDVDLCTRIWKAGYQVVYYPSVQIEYEGTRNARKSKKYAKIFMQSHIRYWRKFGFLRGYPTHKTIYFD